MLYVGIIIHTKTIELNSVITVFKIKYFFTILNVSLFTSLSKVRKLKNINIFLLSIPLLRHSLLHHIVYS